MKKLQLPFALGAACLSLSQAWALTVDENLVITGDRFEQPAATVLAPVTLVDRAQIERMQAHSLTDILRTLPNVDINQYGGRGQNATVTVRGGTSAQTLLLLDGVRLAQGVAGPANINAIPVAQIERIELVRGARASIYGSEAMTGVINIITRQGQDGTQVRLGGGELGRWQADARHQGTLAGGTVKAVLAYEEEEGYNAHPVPGVNDDDKHGFTGKSALFSYDRELGQHFDLYGAARWFQNESQYDNSSLGLPEFGIPDTRERKENRQEALDLQLQLGYQRDDFQAQWLAQTSDSKAYDYRDELGYREAPNYSHLRQHNLAWLNQLQLGQAFTLGAGVDWRREELRDDSTVEDWMTGGGVPFAPETLSRDNTGLFALGRYVQGGHQLELALRSDDNEQFGRHNTWQLGGALALGSHWRALASIGTAFRAPSFYDLYYPGFSNPDLKAEQSDNAELALEGNWEQWDLRLGWFRQEAEDLIQYNQATFRPENIGEALIQGLELELGASTGALEHRLSYSLRDSEDKSNGNELAGSARHNAKYDLTAGWSRYEAGTNLIYRGSRYGDAANSVRLDSYLVVNLFASVALGEHWTLRARLENALDEEYVTIADTFSGGSYPGTPRSVFATVEYRL
ncbi:TonB-dependent receptor domain-containing protein [Ferrimonas marina]|uniref:Vitamin B12 transporter n=1 Tax=Ferrimonas marina TaxID=299255 RepID=A0A1M5VS00_9GAMM|nr:TonB-dependent receptor [Ferrimonas marina]SHH77997.1 vitamin B12 transporter [Ferrimonas marina]